MSQSDDSFERLVERYRPEILAYLRRLLGDEHDAEDASQEMWLRAYRAYARAAPDSQWRAWLYRIATRTAFNALKRRRRDQARRADIALEQVAAAAPDHREQMRAIAHAVQALPPKQHAALMQRQFQGLSYGEIAAALGCSEAAARANVYQALKRLRAALQEA